MSMTNKATLGALAGALVAVIWVAWDGVAVLVVLGFAAIGWLIGMIFQRPDIFIGLLQRLQDR